jgi:NADH-quinone oxidoreductase subunit N
MIASDFTTVLPEVLLSLYAMLALVVFVYTGKDRHAALSVWLTSGAFMLLALVLAMGTPSGTASFGGMFIDDSFARFCKIVILLSAAFVLVMGQDYAAKHDMLKFEYPLLVALSVVGMMVMVSAGSLLTLYMGLELQSLALYVIAAFRRDSAKSTEAGLKYFVLGALSSGLLLYGTSLVYGFAGTVGFSGISAATGNGDLSIGLLLGLVFVIAGMGFKVSAAPFHMWAPDVYEGAPTPVTAFFATAPKMAAMGLFARVVHDAFGGVTADWQQVVAVLSVFSMFLGAVAAIGQKDIKRLMAYSSIAHMGFALMGLAAGTVFGVQAMLIYMAIYISMNIGMFALILSMERDGRPVSDIASLSMLSKGQALKALCVVFIMFSMAGVPPMIGFFGKFYVLRAAYEANMAWLAIAGVVASVIGAYYYIRIVYFMYFGAESEPLDTQTPRRLTVILVASTAVITVGAAFSLFGIEPLAQVAAGSLAN